MKHYLIAGLLFLVILSACQSSRVYRTYKKMPPAERALTDSIFRAALDQEALYSLLDTIKPISSVHFLRFRVAKDSTDLPGAVGIAKNQAAIDSIEMYTRLCRSWSDKEHQFVLVPFAHTRDGYRNLEIYVINKRRFAHTITEHRSFFAQFGITESSDPATVLPLIEYEQQYDRWRGYGYLFGYPDYAVDFFVEAGKQQDSTGRFTERSFFAIPVHKATSGYFTYATPKSYQPAAVDSTIYLKAIKTLAAYRSKRSSYLSKKGIKAMKFWRREKKRFN